MYGFDSHSFVLQMSVNNGWLINHFSSINCTANYLRQKKKKKENKIFMSNLSPKKKIKRINKKRKRNEIKKG